MQKVLTRLGFRRRDPSSRASNVPPYRQNTYEHVVNPAWNEEPPPLPSTAYTDHYNRMYNSWLRVCRMGLSDYTKDDEVGQVSLMFVACDEETPSYTLASLGPGSAQYFANKSTMVYILDGNLVDAQFELCAAAFVQWAEKHAVSGKELPRGDLKHSACAAALVNGFQDRSETSDFIRIHKFLAARVKDAEGQMVTRPFGNMPQSRDFCANQTFQDSFLIVEGAGWSEWKKTRPGLEGSDTFPVHVVMKASMAAEAQLDECHPVVEQTSEDDSTRGWVQQAMDFKSAIALILSLDNTHIHSNIDGYP